MHKTVKTASWSVVALISVLGVSACAPAQQTSAPSRTPVEQSQPPVEQSSTAPLDAPVEETLQPGTGSQIFVVDVDVVTGDTFRATVSTTGNALNGESITIHSEGVTAPAEGECGYSESIEYAESFLAKQTDESLTLIYKDTSLKDDLGVDWIDASGEHTGSLMGYSGAAAQDGFVTVPAGGSDDGYAAYQTLAQNSSKGLWAVCPGFGG